jgi:hypothetical protein
MQAQALDANVSEPKSGVNIRLGATNQPRLNPLWRLGGDYRPSLAHCVLHNHYIFPPSLSIDTQANWRFTRI